MEANLDAVALERCAAALEGGLLAPPAGKLMCGTHSHAQDRHAMCFDGLKMASAHAAVLLHGMSA